MHFTCINAVLQIRIFLPPAEDKPTLLALFDMKDKDGTSLRIVDTIAAHSNIEFGLHLLDDHNGHIVSTINKNKHNDCREVTMEILKRWIDAGGSNCTYKFLMDCLRKIELGGLAEDISSNLMVCQPQETQIFIIATCLNNKQCLLVYMCNMGISYVIE